MGNPVMLAMTGLVPGARAGELPRDGRRLRWAQAGEGGPTVVLDAALGEPGSLAWAGVMAKIAPSSLTVAYDRAGLGMSESASPLTLETSLGDLEALAEQVGNDGCVLVGHSWSGLLAQLVALRRPDLIAGLVLVDSAEELYWASLPAEIHQQNDDLAAELQGRLAAGTLAEFIRDTFERHARQLTEDPGLQELVLQAYEGCYATRAQIDTFPAEFTVLNSSIQAITELRSAPLPDVPMVVLSATEGARPDHRAAWTSLHAKLAASVPRGQHIVLPDTDHAVNQSRPQAVVAAIESVLAAL